MDKTTFTRKEFYDLVWSQPLLTLSKQYEMSDNGLRKACKRMMIPLPEAGHWQKLKAGKELRVKPLPTNYSGNEIITLSLRDENNTSTTNPLAPLLNLQKEIENDPRVSLRVPAKLSSNPDKLIIATKNQLEKKGNYSSNSLVSSTWEALDISVTPGNIGRTLRFMDTLIKALRARGHNIIIENRDTKVIIREAKIKISFREKSKKVVIMERWQRTELHPNGLLCFRIDGYHGKEWVDGKVLVEDQLSKILAKLEIEAIRIIEEERRIREYWAKKEEEKRIRQELEKRQDKELSDFKNLLQEANRWHQAAILRNYAEALKSSRFAANAQPEEFNNMLFWINEKADWYDPLVRKADELLNGADKESLSFKRSSYYY